MKMAMFFLCYCPSKELFSCLYHIYSTSKFSCFHFHWLFFFNMNFFSLYGRDIDYLHAHDPFEAKIRNKNSHLIQERKLDAKLTQMLLTLMYVLDMASKQSCPFGFDLSAAAKSRKRKKNSYIRNHSKIIKKV